MSNLKNKLIKLAYDNPEIRADILPLLKESGYHREIDSYSPSGDSTITLMVGGSVEWVDQAQTLTFDSVREAKDWLKDTIRSGSGEWWVDDAKKALKWLNANA